MSKKRDLIINGYRAGDVVLVLGRIRQEDKNMTVRQVGVAGFRVRGLATCFYWHEKGATWNEKK